MISRIFYGDFKHQENSFNLSFQRKLPKLVQVPQRSRVLLGKAVPSETTKDLERYKSLEQHGLAPEEVINIDPPATILLLESVQMLKLILALRHLHSFNWNGLWIWTNASVLDSDCFMYRQRCSTTVLSSIMRSGHVNSRNVIGR